VDIGGVFAGYEALATRLNRKGCVTLGSILDTPIPRFKAEL